MAQTPTLDDVARAAGVSTATVSRCLNTPERVVEATRTRVMEAVDALGYTPNFAARVMAAKRSMTIGAIVPTLENAIFARALQAFQEELHSAGYTLLVASSGFQPDLERDQIRSLVSRGADGILLIGFDREAALYAYLETQDVPLVIAWSHDPAQPHVSVGFDNAKAMGELADEVFDRGHRTIGVISGATAGNDRIRDRIDGIKNSAAARGLPAAAVEVIETSYDFDGGADALSALMSRKDRPTAIMCVNDVLAVGAMKRAQSMGLNVPDDLSITGFDDIELANLVEPALTTVHVPHRQMGVEAARHLIELVEKKGSGASKKLTTRVCLRASLAPPRS